MQYLRRAREALFVFNKNISDLEVLKDIVNSIGLNGESIINEAEQPIGQQLLNEDFSLARKLGVRGFPTIILMNEDNKGVKITGGRPLEYYVKGLKQVLGKEELEPKEQPTLASLLTKEKLLFSKEIEVMYDIDQSEVQSFVNKELSSDQFETKEILGEFYFTSTK